MEKYKKAFLDLLRGDKTTFIFVVAQFTVGFLFLLAIIMPYMVHPTITGGSLAASKLPGGTIYTLIFLLLIFLFVFFKLSGEEKLTKRVFLGQAILGTLIFFYALLFQKVGIASSSNGIGKLLQLFTLVFFWGFIFVPTKVRSLIDKLIPKKSTNEVKEVAVETKSNQGE
ncbi:MAG: hypothetical protein KKH92_04870 [Firmicutes bacterium]|nr:hypothetical protein [Bacillota bacterium]